MSDRTVLISGAGIAGPTLAYWLARRGFSVTVVERAGRLRSSGSPVDIRGPAVGVVERMGVLPLLRAAATRVTALSFVDDSGREVGRIDTGAIRRAGRSGTMELPRGDLATILYEAARDDVEFLFDDSIVALSQDEHGVDVTFGRTGPRRFGLVIGADGLHSSVRGLAFGAEREFVRHLGLYVATMPADGLLENDREVVNYNTPGRAISLHPGSGKPLVAFIFRAPAEAGFDHRDTGQHRRMLSAVYADAAWRTPELLDRVRATDDLYLDSVSQVLLPRWSRGRVALLGDAASCVSLFGDGSTLAMAGASVLAVALAANPADHQTALNSYEARHRTLVDPRMRNVGLGARMVVPRTRLGITARNLATRLWPVAAATVRLTNGRADRQKGGSGPSGGSAARGLSA